MVISVLERVGKCSELPNVSLLFSFVLFFLVPISYYK